MTQGLLESLRQSHPKGKAFEFLLAKFNYSEHGKFFDECRKHLISEEAHRLWLAECRRTGGVVHGQHGWHWEESSIDFDSRHPDRQLRDEELVNYFKHLVVRERAYTIWLDRRRQTGQSEHNPALNWFRAEQEVNEEFADYTQQIADGRINEEDIYEQLWRRISPDPDASRGWTSSASGGSTVVLTEALENRQMKDARIEAIQDKMRQSKGPFEGMTLPDIERTYGGQILAVDMHRKIIAQAPNEESLREKMRNYSGKWRIYPGFPDLSNRE